jgi:hypothetical protein
MKLMVEAQTVRRARGQRRRSPAVLAAVLVMLLGLAVPGTAQAGKRLILKDGSWQEVLQYEVAGDRTRYLSTRRREWEEVPSELVDWIATEKWNAQPMQAPPEDEAEVPAGATQASATDFAEKSAVVPGLELPSAGGVFILDIFSGQPSLVELIQVPGALNRNAAGIFNSAGGPRTPGKQLLKLRGLSARTQAHIELPQIFIKLADASPAQPIAPADRFRIVRMEPEKESRVLASITVTMMGKRSATQQFVPARVESFGEGWLKIVPREELKPGEYALVEMLDQNRCNSYVWDFGVDPHAPGNLNTRKPYSEATVDERNPYTPELKPRAK